jgi:hypothetical protein
MTHPQIYHAITHPKKFVAPMNGFFSGPWISLTFMHEFDLKC